MGGNEGHDFTQPNPTAAGTTFYGAAGVAANGSAGGFAAAPDGDQVGFVQRAPDLFSKITLAVSGLTAGSYYKVTFRAAQRPGFPSHGVTLRVGGAQLGTFTPASTGFDTFASTAFLAAGSSAVLEFEGDAKGSDAAVGLDAVSVSPASPALPTVANSSLEDPDVGSGYTYSPSASSTTFFGDAGVAGNGSAWGFAAAPDGDQVGFIQRHPDVLSKITLAVSGLTAGSYYKVTFRAAQRPGFPPHRVTLRVGGAQLGAFTPASTGFDTFVSTAFLAAGSSAVLEFEGDAKGSDAAAGLDAVSVSPAS